MMKEIILNCSQRHCLPLIILAMTKFILCGGMFIAMLGCVHAQGIRTSVVSHGKKSKDSSSVTTGSQKMVPAKGYLNDISTYASRDFLKRFKDPKDILWSHVNKGWVVTCTENGINTRTAYNLAGSWVYTIKYYDEWKLPKDVRTLVKSTYFDYTITQVEEIVQQISTEPTYLVHLKDDKSWKNVLVSNGEMVVMEEFDKG